uniref:Uncharacterized protein n=1 Tax=Anguilla anguilla TaxID=7936 RepID=A0A0E9QYG1_ANGAN
MNFVPVILMTGFEKNTLHSIYTWRDSPLE